MGNGILRLVIGFRLLSRGNIGERVEASRARFRNISIRLEVDSYRIRMVNGIEMTD